MAQDVCLSDYDVILINSSGGKDSQTMLRIVAERATDYGVVDRAIVVHADLGRVEWDGTRDLAEAQARHYGFRFEVVTRSAGKKELAAGLTSGDLLDHIEAHGKFPSSTTRYCTSDHKRAQVDKLLTAIVREQNLPRPCRILNCMGFRSQESPARAKKMEFGRDQRASNGKRHVDQWLPIFDWTETAVWDDIHGHGVPYHPAYDAGMPRLSCCFCVLASRSALVRAAQLNPALAAEYVEVETRIGHRFTNSFSMADIVAEAASTPIQEVAGWTA